MSKFNLIILCLFFCFPGFAQNELARRAYWGVNYTEKENKVLLTEISKGYSFDQANAQVNDIILEIEGKAIQSRPEMRTALSGKKAGQELNIKIERNGSIQSLKVTALPYPYEKVSGVSFEYGAFTTTQGDRLRTIVSKPANKKGKSPAVLFIQWLSCDAIDAHPKFKDGNIQLIHDLSKAGFLVMRTEKPGVGDSEGKACGEYGFNYELQVHKEALEELRKRSDVDLEKVFLFGSSMGGTMAPMVAQNQNIKGLIVTGCYYKTWYEHMLEIERRISTLSGDSPTTTNQKMQQWSKFYSLYLNDKMTPAAIIEKHPEYKDLWQDDPEHQYGRPVNFYMEAQAHNVPQYWANIPAPVLVIYGEYDWIMSRADHVMIAEAMNRKQEGLGTFIEVPRAGHGLTLSANEQAAFDSFSPEYDQSLSTKVVEWVKQVVNK